MGNTLDAGELPLADDDPHEPPPGEIADVLERFSDQQVIDALQELPQDQRLALLLVDVEQLGQEDAAAVLEVPVGTIKSRTSRGRATLRKRLAQHARDMGFLGRKT